MVRTSLAMLAAILMLCVSELYAPRPAMAQERTFGGCSVINPGNQGHLDPDQTCRFYNLCFRYANIPACDAALTQLGNEPEAFSMIQFRRGKLLFASNDLVAGRRAFDEIIRVNPAAAGDAHAERARLYLERNDTAAAIEDFNRAIARSAGPGATFGYQGDLGKAQAASGDHRGAVATFTAAIDTFASKLLLVDRAKSYVALRMYPEAVADFDQAIALGPNDAEIVLLRGKTHEGAGDLTRAATDFTEALRLDPRNLEARLRRSDTRYRQKDFAGAVADLDQALADVPNNRHLLLQKRCLARAEWGQLLERALSDCDQAIAADPNFNLALATRGMVRLRMGQFEAAIGDFDAALRINPNFYVAIYGRGVARRGLGQTETGNSDIAAATARSAGLPAYFARFGLTP